MQSIRLSFLNDYERMTMFTVQMIKHQRLSRVWTDIAFEVNLLLGTDTTPRSTTHNKLEVNLTVVLNVVLNTT